MAISFGATTVNANVRANADLAAELEKLKLNQAIAKARAGQDSNTAESPAALQAARLAAAMQQQQAAAGSNQALQSERLQSTERLTATQLAAQMQQLQQRQAGDRTLQTDRLQSTERLTATQLAAQMARLNTDIQGKKDLQAGDIQGKKDLTKLGTDEELRKRKNAATNALALFNATPGSAIGRLDPKAAAAQLA